MASGSMVWKAFLWSSLENWRREIDLVETVLSVFGAVIGFVPSRNVVDDVVVCVVDGLELLI
eukprot:4250069-Amphidinium_carterae.4